MELDYYQRRWLSEHGDRKDKDVFVDEDGLFVVMTNGNNGETKVYIPRK